MLAAAHSGDLADFAAIPRGGALIPIAFSDAFSYVLEGADPHQFYVDTATHEEGISVEEALAQLREAERRRDEAVAKMHEMLAELGYSRARS